MTRAQLIRRSLRDQRTLQRALRGTATVRLRKEAREVAAIVRKGGGLAEVRAYINAGKRVWVRLLVAANTATSDAARRSVRVLVGPGGEKRDTTKPKPKPRPRAPRRRGISKPKPADTARLTREYVSKQALESVDGLAKTSVKRIRTILRKGLSAEDAAVEIEKVLRKSAKHRAGAIARTETHNASQYAKRVAAEETGQKLVKEWMVTSKNPREWHLAADRQRRGLDKKFRVGPDWMDRPGDPSARVGNIANCLCDVIYRRKAA